MFVVVNDMLSWISNFWSRGGGKYCIVAIVLLTLCVVDSNLMRESDQASLIEGSLRIANGEGLVSDNYYNYDKQYFSYWIIAVVYYLIGVFKDLADLDLLVISSNVLCKLFWLVGVAALVKSAPRLSGQQMLLFLLAIVSPTFLFTGPLLSSNILSFGFIGILIYSLSVYAAPSLIHCFLICVMTFCAVGARADACLILPFVCIAREKSFQSLLKNKIYYLMGGAALCALILGRLINESEIYRPSMVFNFKIYAAYILFCLGITLFWLFMFICMIFNVRGSKGSFMYRLAITASLLLPFIYYSFFLYSPRHFTLTVIVLQLSLVLPQTALIWNMNLGRFFPRLFLKISGVYCFALMFFGISITGLPGIKVSFMQSSLFPTADGLWPLGSNLSFLGQLSTASSEPIDNNQESWNTWKQIDVPEEFDMSVIHGAGKSGTISYGNLTCYTLFGSDKTNDLENESPMIFLEDKARVLLESDQDGNEIYKIIAKDKGRFIFLAVEGKVDNDWDAKKALSVSFKGNDFLFFSKPFNLDDFQKKGFLMHGLMEIQYDDTKKSGLEIGGRRYMSREIDDLNSVGEYEWIGISRLPAYMDVNRF